MHPILKLAFLSIALAGFASCSPIVDLRGHSTAQADYSQIVVGQSRAEDVFALLGSPSARSSFGGTTWYYISEKKETRGMLAPQVIDQHVTAIHFDADGTVADISTASEIAARPVELVEKTTPTEGRELTAMEQLMGNFGRFNTPGREINPRNLGR